MFDPITTDEHPDPAAEAEAVDEAAQAALDLERRRAVREADSADLDRATHARRGRRRMRLGNQSVWTTTDSRGKLNAAWWSVVSNISLISIRRLGRLAPR